MTEKEKMLNGRFYDYRDPALERMREKAAGLLSLYNQTGFHERGRRKELLKLVLGDVGENCTIELPFHCDYGCHLHIGKNFYSNIHFTVLDCADVYIGDNTVIENCIVESRDTIRANTTHIGTPENVKIVVEKNERYTL